MHMIRVFSPVSRKTERITDASESAVALAVGNAVGDVEFEAGGAAPRRCDQSAMAIVTDDDDDDDNSEHNDSDSNSGRRQ